MAAVDTISEWIEGLRTGDGSSARKIWEHFILQLHAVVRQRVQSRGSAVYDEEDAAQSAFHSLCAGITAGRFPDLKDREGLWRLLLIIASRKLMHRQRYDQQQRRDVRRTLETSVFRSSDDTPDSLVEGLTSREPTPEFAAEFIETCEILFDDLRDPMLQQIGWLRLEGYADHEIAAQLNCSRRTVQRRLEIIRRRWSDYFGD